MKIGYYPGCSLKGTAKEYDESLHAVALRFGIELVEVKDWNCCGATAAHSLNKNLSIALPARDLALAEAQGFDELLVPCAACYSRLATARHEFRHDEKVRAELPKIIEMPYTGKCKPINVIEFLEKYIVPELGGKVEKSLGFKAACYYGCLLVRPPKIAEVERYENPDMMEKIMKALGAEPIDWAFKTECCGAGLSIAKSDIIGKLSGRIMEDAVDRGAEAVIVACPMCQSNLDMRRGEINGYLSKKINAPVLFITQAIGLALGASRTELGLDRHIVPVGDMIPAMKLTESINSAVNN